jgi:hypothetical protein
LFERLGYEESLEKMREKSKTVRNNIKKAALRHNYFELDSEDGYGSEIFQYGNIPEKNLVLQKKETCFVLSRQKADYYLRECDNLCSQFSALVQKQNKFLKNQRQSNQTPFVSASDQELVLHALQEYSRELENHLLNAEKLRHEVEGHATA